MEAGKQNTPERERFTIETRADTRSALHTVAKTYKITQGEVLDAIFDAVDVGDVYAGLFRAAREKKVAGRQGAKVIQKALDLLSDDELQEILRQRAEQRGELK